jgi:hypothetical protein
MEEAPENGKELSHSARQFNNSMNEQFIYKFDQIKSSVLDRNMDFFSQKDHTFLWPLSL